MLRSLVGSEMCIRDRVETVQNHQCPDHTCRQNLDLTGCCLVPLRQQQLLLLQLSGPVWLLCGAIKTTTSTASGPVRLLYSAIKTITTTTATTTTEPVWLLLGRWLSSFVLTRCLSVSFFAVVGRRCKYADAERTVDVNGGKRRQSFVERSILALVILHFYVALTEPFS